MVRVLKGHLLGPGSDIAGRRFLRLSLPPTFGPDVIRRCSSQSWGVDLQSRAASNARNAATKASAGFLEP